MPSSHSKISVIHKTIKGRCDTVFQGTKQRENQDYIDDAEKLSSLLFLPLLVLMVKLQDGILSL
jgi:hypothetical protein